MQTVIRLTGNTSPQDLKAFEEAVPAIDSHEVLVEIKAVSLNYRDLAISTGKYPLPTKQNVVPGSDGAGIVKQVGGKVSGFKVGDRVVGVFDPANLYGPVKDAHNAHGGPVDGMLRQFVPLVATSLLKIPESCKLSFAELSTLPCTGVTAWNALYGGVPIKPGQTVLFQGTGGVSMTGLMLARALGARTIITSSSDDKLKIAKEQFGADHVINYRTTPNWSEKALEITGGEGVDYLLENGGSGTIAQSINCTRVGGQVVIIGFLSQAKQQDMPDVATLALIRAVTLRGILVGSRQLFEDLLNFVVVKELKPLVEKTIKFSRDEVVKAYEYVASGAHMGKVVITLD